MFYEFSIQYDDQPVMLLEQTPLSDILYFRVNHAYPNWIPPHYPKMLDEMNPDSKSNISSTLNSNSMFLTFPFFSDFSNDKSNFTFQYHRYIHLIRTYMNSYLPSDISISPQDSLTSLIMKIVSPLVPQGKWTTGSSPPQPNEFFYRHFPKQSPDFDNDYHTRNPGVFWGWFYLARWLPNLIQNVLFPLDNIVYNSKLDDELNNSNKKTTTIGDDSLDEKKEKFIPKARKLMGKHTPTLLECQLCNNFNGFMVWNRNDEWFCVYKNKLVDLIDDHVSSNDIKSIDDLNKYIKSDHDGKRYFTSFNNFVDWQSNHSKKIIELEKNAYNAENMNEMLSIENEINELKILNKRKDNITAKSIVSVKG